MQIYRKEAGLDMGGGLRLSSRALVSRAEKQRCTEKVTELAEAEQVAIVVSEFSDQDMEEESCH